MKVLFVRAAPALLAAAAVSLAGAGPAQALTSCSVMTPCLPLNAGFTSTLPTFSFASFFGNEVGFGVLHGENDAGSSSADTSGVLGVYGGSGRGSGVLGSTASGAADDAGVFGRLSNATPGANAAGVRGEATTTGSGGIGVFGLHDGSGTGVFGQSGSGNGVAGESTASNGGNGVQGISHTPTSSGVYGQDLAGGYGLAGRSNGDTPGGVNTAVLGDLTAFSPLAGATAVRGMVDGTNGNGYGVWGSHAGSGTGVLGQSSSGIGVLGYSDFVGLLGYAPAGGYAGYFAGDAVVSGTLYKGAGAFRIDHPLDPAHKYLQHSFVESPDMMDVYNGNVTTDSKGFATVKLPAYFQALNRSFRYQLTIVGRSFAQAIVWKEIANNNFTIKTNQPEVKVSWQVTGIRHDAYANAHRIPVVVQKQAAEQGKYLHPELYGKPRSLSVVPKLAAKALAQARR